MSFPQFSRSQSLNNIPSKKIENYLSNIASSNDDNKSKQLKNAAILRFVESNIPVEYWNLKMDKNFHGDIRLLEKYNEYIADLQTSYLLGTSICFAGNHGVGKTMSSCCILKTAALKGYTCLYSTLENIVNALTTAPTEEKYVARIELTKVDFLVIDEFDPRFMPSENAADLYARTLEGIFRTRSQNKLPTIMCTNSPNVVESFNGALKNSISSLMSGYIKVFPVFGEDHRKKKS